MKFDIHSQGFPLTDALREHAERRLAFALSRFHDRLEHMSMRLADDNGPRGGVDKRCQVRLRLHGAPEVVITEVSEDLYVAIDRAADRAGRTAARRIERGNNVAHDSLPVTDFAVKESTL
ncbi:MAG: HPF/RaiA family ribosome-associated protein [Sulfuricellaceae bacterium]|nr:HPF/RaiA family ribosome-associated protein [Sulfuricellaceae bacterium]